MDGVRPEVGPSGKLTPAAGGCRRVRHLWPRPRARRVPAPGAVCRTTSERSPRDCHILSTHWPVRATHFRGRHAELRRYDRGSRARRNRGRLAPGAAELFVPIMQRTHQFIAACAGPPCQRVLQQLLGRGVAMRLFLRRTSALFVLHHRRHGFHGLTTGNAHLVNPCHPWLERLTYYIASLQLCVDSPAFSIMLGHSVAAMTNLRRQNRPGRKPVLLPSRQYIAHNLETTL